ncbi:heterokaryon incompatibility protein-domain-containing protein [Lasiosphaeria ovina]|uniref:Heterokaryon incompatibility protein-domain-containing protein n=1 Tax=Lasiosphaeria ovina TaxID=92902 RepID=A0AAE0N1I2_9PEZI|nr:heterokaryon incompatibility protein-domain-containing protein [Lasiosphaeria ovina]
MDCLTCRNLQLYRQSGQLSADNDRNSQNVNGPKEITLHYLPDFQKSASGGCPFCRFIVRAFLHHNLTPLEDSRITLWTRKSGACDLEVLSESGTAATIQIYSPIKQRPAWPTIVHSAELSCSPDSPEAFDFIQSYLQDCNTNHEGCKVASPDPPTRLIDVGLPGMTDVRLVHSSTLPTPVRYLALSYCWGTKRTLTTVTANLDDMKRRIPLPTLPRTIRDAIAVTRKLEQRYLWVDAICIIQDSAADWEVESSQMATVYRNAYLTLAAGTSAASDEGFLSHEHHAAGFRAPYHEPWHDESGGQAVLGARVIPGIHTHTDTLDEEDVMPLDDRAWTLQEGVLARRILTYTKHELRWTCVSGTACECGLFGEFAADPFRSVFSVTEETEVHRLWYQVLERYTRRQITYVKDRLPALSGIAKVVQAISRSEYVAGLWSKTLIRDLAWSAVYEEYALAEYVAPTFSWASIPGSVDLQRTYDLGRGRWVSRSTVEGFECVPLGQNPLGRVQSGWIILRGHIIKSMLRGSGPSGYYAMHENVKIRVYPDTILEEFSSINKNGTAETSVRRSPLVSGEATETASAGSLVYFLFIGQWIGRLDIGAKNDDYRMQAFLLLGHSPSQLGKYERIGYATCSGHEELEAWFHSSLGDTITIV